MDLSNFIDYSEFFTDSEWLVGIDSGHGGIIDGVYQTAPAKMFKHPDFTFCEGEFTRNVTILLANHLRRDEISHFFTTNSNLDVSLPVRVNRSNNFLRSRKDKKQLFLSIHGNAAPKGAESARGIEVFTSKGETASDPMADIFYKHLSKMNWKMRKDTADGDFDKEAQFYVLRKTNSPAVLVELGFYTNLAEAKQMLDPKVQAQFAKHLFNAIKEIMS